jgi:2',3'-cyclic-nucleotide 2'-phosphodiesterase (5'-nucleotidase family)
MGGLARRASKIDTFRRPDQGLIILDSGDSLVERGVAMHEAAENLRPKAGTMIRAMGHMGTDALLPGENDLATGLKWLAKEAGHAGLPLLAANLKPRKGRSPFKARKLVKTGGVKVGLLGLVDLAGEPEEIQELLKKSGVKQLPALAAGKAQIKALNKAGAEVIVLLAHMPQEVLNKLLAELNGVHLAISGHQGLRMNEAARVGKTFVVEAGRRGMELGHVVLELGRDWSKDKELADDSMRYVMHERITRQIGVLKQLLSTVDPGQAPPATAVELNKRIRKMVEEYNGKAKVAAPNRLAALLHPLDETVADHAAVKALITGEKAAPPADPPAGAVPAGQPIKPQLGTPMRIPDEEVRRMEERAAQEAR